MASQGIHTACQVVGPAAHSHIAGRHLSHHASCCIHRTAAVVAADALADTSVVAVAFEVSAVVAAALAVVESRVVAVAQSLEAGGAGGAVVVVVVAAAAAADNDDGGFGVAAAAGVMADVDVVAAASDDAGYVVSQVDAIHAEEHLQTMGQEWLHHWTHYQFLPYCQKCY